MFLLLSLPSLLLHWQQSVMRQSVISDKLSTTIKRELWKRCKLKLKITNPSFFLLLFLHRRKRWWNWRAGIISAAAQLWTRVWWRWSPPSSDIIFEWHYRSAQAQLQHLREHCQPASQQQFQPQQLQQPTTPTSNKEQLELQLALHRRLLGWLARQRRWSLPAESAESAAVPKSPPPVSSAAAAKGASHFISGGKCVATCVRNNGANNQCAHLFIFSLSLCLSTL